MVNDWIYYDLKNYDNRYEVYYGGSGSGKSYGAMLKIILKSCDNERTVLVVRKVKATILHSIYELCKNILMSVCNDFRIKVIENKTELTIYLSNGSKFIFKGMDDSEKIKSITNITDIVIEEATELSFSDFTQLDLRLRPKEEKPQIFLMFNPISKANWCYKHWFLRENPNTLMIKTTYRDNKFLNDDYKNALENLVNTNENYYKVYCLGEFITLDRLVFPKIFVEDLENLDTLELSSFIGLDFGYVNDPTAIISGFYSEDTIYITGEFVKKGLSNDDICSVLENLGLKSSVIVADSAEIKSIDYIKSKGFKIRPSKKGKGSVINDIEFILRHKIIIDKRLLHTLEEFNNYTWTKDKSTGEYINTPIDKFNHTIDALRYGLQCVTKNKGSLKIIK